jgi:hypothetical protein
MPKTFYVWKHFEGAMRLEVEANSPEEALAMAIHPSNSLRWEIDPNETIFTDQPMKTEEMEQW